MATITKIWHHWNGRKIPIQVMDKKTLTLLFKKCCWIELLKQMVDKQYSGEVAESELAKHCSLYKLTHIEVATALKWIPIFESEIQRRNMRTQKPTIRNYLSQIEAYAKGREYIQQSYKTAVPNKDTIIRPTSEGTYASDKK